MLGGIGWPAAYPALVFCGCGLAVAAGNARTGLKAAGRFTLTGLKVGADFSRNLPEERDLKSGQQQQTVGIAP